MNIVLLGPPGSGKGTQAKSIAAKYNLTHLSTGDVFREAITNRTPLGIEIKGFVESGKLVPDELVSEVVFEKIGSLKSGFLLDGYPRTVDQAKALAVFSAAKQLPIDIVLLFDVNFPELVKRLSARRQCSKCKEVYNLVQKPPKVENACDKCGSPLSHRPDDQPAVVEERLNIYTLQTEPVLSYYVNHPGYRRINGAQPIATVAAEIEQALSTAAAK
jgi:adenylate kinase